MLVTVALPDAFAARFGSAAERDRHVLEVLALDEYRAGRMSQAELQTVLEFGSPRELYGFLRNHCIFDDASSPLECESEEERESAATELVRRSRALRAGKSLGGLSVKGLIAEGRR